MLDRGAIPHPKLKHVFQISPVLKNTIFRSRAIDIHYEALDSNEWYSPVHIGGLHRFMSGSRTMRIPFDPLYVTLRILILKFWRMKLWTLIFRQSFKCPLHIPTIQYTISQ